jgi:hypothetical protein
MMTQQGMAGVTPVVGTIGGFFLIVLTACDSTPEFRPMTPGREIFERDILTLLNGVCADCHSNANDEHSAPDFLDTADGQYYESLVGRPDFVGCAVENSLLLVKGLHSNHPGGKLTGPQQEKMQQWLTQEAIDRFQGECAGAPVIPGSGGMGEAPLTGKVAIEQFGACMSLDVWNSAGMPLVGATIALEGQQPKPCYSCHDEGSGGNWMPDPNSANAAQEIANSFGQMRQPYSIYHLVQWTVNDADASFKDIVPANRWREKGKDQNHPTYTLSLTSQGYIEAWFNTTYEKWKNGPCTP